MAWLRKNVRLSPGRAVDIGTKDGTAVRVLTDAGWEAVGYDPDVRFHSYAAEQLGVTIRPHLFTSETTEPNSLDLVTAFHMIEHVTDPVALLGTIHQALRPGGYVYLETPNVRHMQSRQLSPGHVVLYTTHTLSQTVMAAGFVVRAVTECAPGGPRTYDQLALVAQRGQGPGEPPHWRLGSVDQSTPLAMARAAAGRFPAWSFEWPPSRAFPMGVYRAVLRRLRRWIRRAIYSNSWSPWS